LLLQLLRLLEVLLYLLHLRMRCGSDELRGLHLRVRCLRLLHLGCLDAPTGSSGSSGGQQWRRRDKLHAIAVAATATATTIARHGRRCCSCKSRRMELLLKQLLHSRSRLCVRHRWHGHCCRPRSCRRHRRCGRMEW
jgi:hypothetical protein